MTESVLKADEGEGGMHEHRNAPPHLARAYKKQTTPPLPLESHPVPCAVCEWPAIIRRYRRI